MFFDGGLPGLTLSGPWSVIEGTGDFVGLEGGGELWAPIFDSETDTAVITPTGDIEFTS